MLMALVSESDIREFGTSVYWKWKLCDIFMLTFYILLILSTSAALKTVIDDKISV